jgi:NADH dehydrogenase, FAD-containing subunit
MNGMTIEAPDRPRILVLGGGFAGIGAVRSLKQVGVDVVLIDEHDYHTLQPSCIRSRPTCSRSDLSAADRSV